MPVTCTTGSSCGMEQHNEAMSTTSHGCLRSDLRLLSSVHACHRPAVVEIGAQHTATDISTQAVTTVQPRSKSGPASAPLLRNSPCFRVVVATLLVVVMVLVLVAVTLQSIQKRLRGRGRRGSGAGVAVVWCVRSVVVVVVVVETITA